MRGVLYDENYNPAVCRKYDPYDDGSSCGGSHSSSPRSSYSEDYSSGGEEVTDVCPQGVSPKKKFFYT